jgi:hypothetical protein
MRPRLANTLLRASGQAACGLLERVLVQRSGRHVQGVQWPWPEVGRDHRRFSRPVEVSRGRGGAGADLLILDRIEILPKYQGGGAGLLVLISLIERFGAGAGVLA